ncbi:UGT1 protein [Loa loa]|uniref:UGT1 protein n=1 Tax=Loa loa TaxID=7209 RepID=A0A1S0UFI5_LOALO|nr:UGT1 protein [Loa loa]EJD74349.1 UGT1 protein [Loa loa]
MVHHLDQQQGEFLSSKFSIISSSGRYSSLREKFHCLMDRKNLKWASLIVLILQTTVLVLVLHYSRVQKVDGPRYLSSTAVVTAEIIKLLTCIVFIAHQHSWECVGFMNEIYTECYIKSKDTLKMAVPAFLYVVQNNLLFLALSKLDAATYQVTYQLKILTTALFSVTLLGKKLNSQKWISLLLLTVGVALVQLPDDFGKITSSTTSSALSTDSDKMVGLITVIAACFSSGFAGVYFEKVLKSSSVSLWMRNLQLAFFSIFGGFFMVWFYDFKQVNEHGFFQGYNSIIWTVVLLQAYGGLVIALVVKYADNILKGFAVSFSIVLSSVMSYWLLGDFPTIIDFCCWCIGCHFFDIFLWI